MPIAQFANDITEVLVNWGPILAVIFFLVVIIMYILAYLTRYFHYLTTKEFTYLDDKTLGFVKRVSQTLIIGLTILVVIFLAAQKSPEINDVFVLILKHMPSIFFVIIVITIAVVIVRLIHRFAEFLRGNLKRKPTKIAPPGTLEYAEMVLKYTIYVVSAVIAFIGGLALLPEGENVLRDIINNIGASIDTTILISIITSIVLLLVVTIIISKVLDTFYEDLHKHSRKYTMRVNEILKGISKNILYLIAFLIGVFIILSKFLSYTELLLTLGIIILTTVLLAFLMSDIIRNSFSGLALMISDPFSEGDRVRIMNGMVCDVLSTNLTHAQVKTLKGEMVSVPNMEMMKHEIVNLSRSEVFALSISIGVDARKSHQKVGDMLLQAAENTTGIVNEPTPEIFGKEIENGVIMYELLAYTNSPKELNKIKSELIYNIQEIFQSERIDLNTQLK